MKIFRDYAHLADKLLGSPEISTGIAQWVERNFKFESFFKGHLFYVPKFLELQRSL